MVAIGQMGGMWTILLNVSFMCAAFFHDILLIRICLLLGYVGLFLNAVTGYPGWGDGAVADDYFLSVDTLVFSLFTGFFHLFAVVRLLRDEAKVTLTDKEERIWRYFYRRAGMPRLEFKKVFSMGHCAEFRAGEVISPKDQPLTRFYLILKGVVRFRCEYNHIADDSWKYLRSGDLFDLHLANVFGVSIGFQHSKFFAEALTDCHMLYWDITQLHAMAAHSGPAIASYWRNLIMFQLALELNRGHLGVFSNGSYDSTGKLESPGWLQGQESADFWRPMKVAEELKLPWYTRLLKWLKQSFGPFPPSGLRHNALPRAGILARNRVVALMCSLGTKLPNCPVPEEADGVTRTNVAHVNTTILDWGDLLQSSMIPSPGVSTTQLASELGSSQDPTNKVETIISV
eukprot:m.114503 g.114503  ORF g.114503 m.114503 type:complete len:401 (-) comp13541_c0_seq2:199-1401(-)